MSKKSDKFAVDKQAKEKRKKKMHKAKGDTEEEIKAGQEFDPIVSSDDEEENDYVVLVY